MATRSLLYERELRINDNMSVVIPTVAEVLRDEDEYYKRVSLLTATPYDMMVQLDDAGVDFETIDDYGLFLRTYLTIGQGDTSLLFRGFDLSCFVPRVNPANDLIVLYDPNTGIMIDKGVHAKLCDAVRKIHHLKRNHRTPGDASAKRYLLERQRKKLSRRSACESDSQMENLIVAMVNTEQFSYDFEGVRNMTIYQFNESVQQVVKKINFDNRMHGIYSGTVSAKDLSETDLNWMKHD